MGRATPLDTLTAIVLLRRKSILLRSRILRLMRKRCVTHCRCLRRGCVDERILRVRNIDRKSIWCKSRNVIRQLSILERIDIVQLFNRSRRICIMHIPSRRNTGHTTRHTTLRSRWNRPLSRQRWIQIQRIERILLSRSAERVILSLLSHILSAGLGTLERRRRIQLTRILSIPVIIRCDFPKLRRDVR